MNASDVMSKAVVSVHPDTPVREIARVLIENGISAVPVIDNNGVPMGIVSEGDLIRADRREREARRDRWLEMLAEGEQLSPEFLAWVHSRQRVARAIMSAPLVTVSENTEIGEIARLLVAHRIKRVPVVRDSRIVGIVARADLLHALIPGTPGG